MLGVILSGTEVVRWARAGESADATFDANQPAGVVDASGWTVTGSAPNRVLVDLHGQRYARELNDNAGEASDGGSSPSGSLVSARVASTGNLSLSGIPDPSLTDGVTVADGDRVLVWMQSTPAQNGVYVAAAGAWALSADYADMQVGDTIGTVYDGDTWYASLFIRDSDTTFAALCQAGTPYFSRTGFYTLGGFKLKVVGLPTADPHAVNQLWNDDGTLKVSAG